MNISKMADIFSVLFLTIVVVNAQEIPKSGEGVVVNVASDTYIRNGEHSKTNFSAATDLRAMHYEKDLSQILLRFELSKSEKVPDSAYIWIRTTSDHSDPVENAAYFIPDNDWECSTVTWDTKPKIEEELDAWVTENDHSIKIDVTKQVVQALKGDGKISIAVRAPHDVGSKKHSIYHSIESAGSLSSQLMIRYNEPKAYVKPGESIQQAIDDIHKKGGGQVILGRGVHKIEKSISMNSHITLRGQGAKQTIIRLDRKANEPLLIGTRIGRITKDITIQDLSLDGQQAMKERNLPGDTKRESVRGDTYGIFFTDQSTGNKFERIRIRNVRISRCSMGIHFKGVNDLRILNSEIFGNGCLIGYDHNVYFRRARNALLKNLNISDCTAGNGFNLSTDCHNVIIDGCDASDNYFRGIRFEAKDLGSRMMIINCKVNNNGKHSKQAGIRVANVPGFVILGTTANSNGGAGIYCVNAKNGLIKNCEARRNKGKDYDLQRCKSVKEVDNE